MSGSVISRKNTPQPTSNNLLCSLRWKPGALLSQTWNQNVRWEEWDVAARWRFGPFPSFPPGCVHVCIDQAESLTTLTCHISAANWPQSIWQTRSSYDMRVFGFVFHTLTEICESKAMTDAGAVLGIMCKLPKALDILASTLCREQSSVTTGTSFFF